MDERVAGTASWHGGVSARRVLGSHGSFNMPSRFGA